MTAHDKDDRLIAIRGRAVGAFAAVWLEEEPKAFKASLDFESVLDALPIPVWLRDRTLSLLWGNRAFLNATGAIDRDAAVTQQLALEKSERDLASAARSEGAALEAKRFTVVGGQRRALAFTHVPVSEGHIVRHGHRRHRHRQCGSASCSSTSTRHPTRSTSSPPPSPSSIATRS